MQKIDYKQVYRELYGNRGVRPRLIALPPMQYLMIDGQGDPERGPRFSAGLEALFSMARAIRTQIRNGPMSLDFVVMPLEVLWWSDEDGPNGGQRGALRWTQMLMMPPVVGHDLFAGLHAGLSARQPLVADLRLAPLEEGRVAQVSHYGPFATQGESVARLHEYVREQGLIPQGPLHGIYLSDPRRIAPDRRNALLHLRV